MAFIKVDLGKVGETTCACKDGRCRFLVKQFDFSSKFQCALLKREILHSDGTRELQRFKECLDMQVKS